METGPRVARWSFAPEGQHELQLNVGDHVWVQWVPPDITEEHCWVFGRNYASMGEGWFPWNHLTRRAEGGVPAPPPLPACTRRTVPLAMGPVPPPRPLMRLTSDGSTEHAIGIAGAALVHYIAGPNPVEDTQFYYQGGSFNGACAGELLGILAGLAACEKLFSRSGGVPQRLHLIIGTDNERVVEYLAPLSARRPPCKKLKPLVMHALAEIDRIFGTTDSHETVHVPRQSTSTSCWCNANARRVLRSGRVGDAEPGCTPPIDARPALLEVARLTRAEMRC